MLCCHFIQSENDGYLLPSPHIILREKQDEDSTKPTRYKNGNFLISVVEGCGVSKIKPITNFKHLTLSAIKHNSLRAFNRLSSSFSQATQRYYAMN